MSGVPSLKIALFDMYRVMNLEPVRDRSRVLGKMIVFLLEEDQDEGNLGHLLTRFVTSETVSSLKQMVLNDSGTRREGVGGLCEGLAIGF